MSIGLAVGVIDPSAEGMGEVAPEGREGGKDVRRVGGDEMPAVSFWAEEFMGLRAGLVVEVLEGEIEEGIIL